LKKRSGQPVGARKRTGVRRKRSSLPAAGVLDSAVFLVGFMGAGKTSVGRSLGEQLNCEFEDLDDRIERREGRTVAEIFRDSGEPAFRRTERAALQEVLEELRGGGTRIVALGGGAFAQKDNAALLLAAGVPTVFLDAPLEHLWRRCSQQSNRTGAERPLLKSREQFGKLYDARHRSYLKAGLRVQTENRTVVAVAAEIAQTLAPGLKLKKPKLKKIVTRIEEGEVE
jgi:shikimate kinase